MDLKFNGTRMRALLLSGLMLGTLSTAFAAETKTDAPGRLDLRLEEGKVTGRVDDRPLAEVLERLSQLQPFSYSGAPALLEHEISKGFTDMSFGDALRHVLDGYDYYLVTDAHGAVLQLTITNLSGDAPHGARKRLLGGQPEKQPADGPDAVPPLDESPVTVEAAPGVPLSHEERAAFEAGMQEGLTPELYEAFHPETPPEAVVSGPPSPPGIEILEVPQADPEATLTGPASSNR